MYWRYRNITRHRQRLQIRWAARRRRQPVYQAPGGRGIRPVGYSGGSRMARSWALLVVAVVGIAVLQHYEQGGNLVFIGDIAILAAAYFVWLQLDK